MTSIPNAWLAVDHGLCPDPRIAPYAAVLKGGRAKYLVIAEGDWMLVLNPAGDIVRAGRVPPAPAPLRRRTPNLFKPSGRCSQCATAPTGSGVGLNWQRVTRISYSQQGELDPAVPSECRQEACARLARLGTGSRHTTLPGPAHQDTASRTDVGTFAKSENLWPLGRWARSLRDRRHCGTAWT